MKKIFICSIAAYFVCVSCSDKLDTKPLGGTVTEEQKDEIEEKNPTMVAADVKAMISGLTAYEEINGDYNFGSYHYDFGYASVCLMYDESGQDMSSPNTGYDWYAPSLLFDDRDYTGSRSYFVWKTYYKTIKSANDILRSATADTEDATLKSFRGQALAARAFCYLQMAQMYQFTYISNQDKPCVPIVTDETTVEEGANNPRATVQEVYNLVIKDLNEAITLLGTGRASKDVINQNVAFGLRARANLVMNNWQAAADDAKAAMVSHTVYSMKEISTPRFYDAADKSWIWGIIITEDDDVVLSGILNWQSHLSSLTGNGYTTAVGAYRAISKVLYDEIPETDIRKTWWVDEKLKSNLFAAYGLEDTTGIELGYAPYTNVKFGPNDGTPFNPTNAGDWVIMRAEEMVFIQAEALAMAGNVSGGKAILEDFVKTNRNPNYSCTAMTSQEVQDEVWMQRRVELWGEGFSLFDILRLKKGVTRVYKGTNFTAAAQFNVAAESPALLYMIPESEIQTNDGISLEENNPIVTPPTP